MTDTSEEQSATDETAASIKSSEEVKPGPRAFARGTGIVFQTVGILLTVISCCSCPFGIGEEAMETGQVSELMQQPENAPSTSLLELLNDPARLGIVLIVAATTIGGLGMAGYGLGLQADKPKASLGALIATTLHLLLQLIAGICLWTAGGSGGMFLWNAILLLLSILLVAMAIGAFIDVRKDPPPPDLDILPPDYEIPKSIYH